MMSNDRTGPTDRTSASLRPTRALISPAVSITARCDLDSEGQAHSIDRTLSIKLCRRPRHQTFCTATIPTGFDVKRFQHFKQMSKVWFPSQCV